MGLPPPDVIWHPDPRLVGNRTFHQFDTVCNIQSKEQTAIPEEALDLGMFGSMLDWMILCAPEDNGPDFRYEHFGKGIVRVLGDDMNGKTSSGYAAHCSAFFNAVYRDVRCRKERVMTAHQPMDQIFVTVWRRLIVPVCNRTGDIVRMLVLCCPENELREGLEILPVPVLILDSDHVVLYANKTARQDFDEGNFGPWTRSVFDYAGLDLVIREQPEDILASGITQTSTCRHVKLQRIGQYQATVSAARYRDRAFYVVLLQRLA